MTSIGTLRELDTAVDEAFDQDVPCEYHHHDLRGNGAAVVYGIKHPVNLACGCPALKGTVKAVCAGCFAYLHSAGGRLTCTGCRGQCRTGDVIVRWEPIR